MKSKYLKKAIKSILPETAIPSIRYVYFRYFRGARFAAFDLDRKLEQYINYDNGFFVELGANDGFTQSNTYYFEKKRGWKGVLVEPSPHLYMSCVRFRGNGANSLYCNACVGFDYNEKYVDIEYADLMSISSNLELDLDDKEKFLETGRKVSKLGYEGISFGAKARTLNSLLLESGAPKVIDLLSLDVEGAELQVLKGIDFDEFKFKYMLIECRNLPRLQSFLSEKGYSQIDKLSHHDYLFTSGG